MASSASTSHSSDHYLSLGLLNINGLRDKISDVQYIMSEHKLQVLALCETKLDSEVKDSKLYIPGYRMYRRDRQDNGGGVALYIQNHIPTKPRSDLMNPEVEIIWVEMKLPDSRPVLVGCCYRPPRNCYKKPMTNEKYLDQICEMIKQVSKEDRDIFLLGDFNINWLAGLKQKDQADISEKEKLSSVISKCGLTQIVNCWTKETDESSKCIDHIYTNIPESCSEPKPTVTGCSDHHLITVRVSKKIPKKTRNHRSLEIFNHESFIRDLKEAQWSDVEAYTDPQKALDKFKKSFVQCANKHSTIKTESNKDSVMVHEELKPLIKKRDKAKRKKNPESDSNINKKKCKYLKKRVSEQSKKLQTESFRKQLIDAGNDRDKIFEIFTEFLGYNLPSDVIDVKCEDLTPEEEFQNYLKQMQTETENLQFVFECFEAQYEMEEETSLFSFKEVEPEMIKTLLSSLCDSGIIELDQTEAELFRLVAAPICHILNRIINSSVFPSEWNKIRDISRQTNKYNFIREKDCLEGFDFILSLIFDLILLHQTKQYFTDKNPILLTSLQDELKKDWLTEIKNRKTVGAMFLHFSSSFDSISHDLLLKKLNSYGFSVPALELIKSFFTSAGLPRGSFFSHFLFSIFTKNVWTVLKNSSVVMSDNQFLIYHADKNRQKSEQLLKADIKSVTKWADENKIILNQTETIKLETSDQIDQSFNLLRSVQSCIHGQINWIRVLTVILLNEKHVWTNEYKTILKKLEKGFTKTFFKDISVEVKNDVINSLTLLQLDNRQAGSSADS